MVRRLPPPSQGSQGPGLRPDYKPAAGGAFRHSSDTRTPSYYRPKAGTRSRPLIRPVLLIAVILLLYGKCISQKRMFCQGIFVIS